MTRTLLLTILAAFCLAPLTFEWAGKAEGPVLVASISAQELPTAKMREDVTYYVAMHLKFKSGKGKEAKEIIYDHFLPANKAIGHEVIVFEYMTGEWDQVVYFSLTEGPGELAWEMSPTNEKWNTEFAKREGGIEKAKELNQRFEELVAKSKREIVMTKRESSAGQ
jgi:hypothetical protein